MAEPTEYIHVPTFVATGTTSVEPPYCNKAGHDEIARLRALTLQQDNRITELMRLEGLASSQNDDRAAEITRLRSDNQKLREALKPFADGADTVEKSYSTAPHMLTDDLMTGYWPMTLGGLRRARSVLTGTEAPGSSVTAEEASDHTRLPKSI